jgi:choline dehydrogenase-like flavoprotein
MTTAGRGIAEDYDVPVVTYDHDDDSVVVVIGSGAGGGTMADELTQHGIDVVLLEAGPRFQMSEFENDEWVMYERLTWLDKRTTTGTSPIALNFPTAPAWTCKGLGGTTLHWAAMCPRAQPYEFNIRSIYGAVDGANLADWPIDFEDLEPFYLRAELKMGVTGRNGIPFHETPNDQKVMELGAKRVGYRDFGATNLAINAVPRDGRNGCDQIGFCMQGCRSGAKWSTFNSELPRAEATGRCEIRTNSMAIRIEHDAADQASGVLYADRTGTHHRQKARLVCVAANSFETTRLLLNSESSRHPHGLANGSGQLGKNYMSHSTGYVYAAFEEPVHMNRGTVCAGIVRDEARHDPSRGFAGGYNIGTIGLGLPFYAGFLSPGRWGRDYASWIEDYSHITGLHITGEDLAIETNRITLHPSVKDQHGLPIPSLHVDDHPNDLALKSHGYTQAIAMLEAAGATRVFESPPLPVSHNLGTCRMSAEPDDGVVNQWGQSHEIPNLFVSDGSQFTSSQAPNPTLTIVALAIRQAGYIAEQMRTKQL